MKNKLLGNLKLTFLVATCSVIQSISFAQSPPTLGTTSSFALFTAVGAFDNDGATHVTGDIGTNVGAFTGFPPGTVVGQSHAADPASVQAAIDVDVAYSALGGTTCGVVIGTTLGNSQVLTPDVYCLGAASSLTGDLILDAEGNPNALFIIKIDGALATSTNSNVILINSASLCNVYWQINGAFELGDGSVFRGTLLINGAITLLEGSTLFGRALSRGGAVELHNNLVAIGVQPIATITAGGTTDLCPGGSVTLTAASSGTGPYSYSWSPGGQTNSSITVSPTVTTPYIVTVTANNGCSAALDTMLVTINNSDTVYAGVDQVICPGVVTLAGFTGGSSAGATWSGGTGTFSPNNTTLNAVYTPSTAEIAAGSVTLTLTTFGGCSIASDQVVITINASATVDAGADQVICPGIGITLAGVIGGSATSGTWSGGTGTYSPNNTTLNAVYTPSTADITAGTVVFTLTTSGGSCPAVADQTTVTLTNPIVDLGPDTTVCGCILLYAGNIGSTFEWSNGADYSTVNICVGGSYWVKVSNGTCYSYDSINIIVNALPVVDLGNDTTLSGTIVLDAGNAGAEYNWSTGSTDQLVTVDSSGTYYVSVTNSLGCTSTDTVNITVLTGIDVITNEPAVNVYPNPTTGVFTFEMKEIKDASVRITNILGETIHSEKINSQTTIMNIKGVPNGVYFMEIKVDGKVYSRKLAKE